MTSLDLLGVVLAASALGACSALFTYRTVSRKATSGRTLRMNLSDHGPGIIALEPGERAIFPSVIFFGIPE